jgi:hypothetical protein
MADGFIVRRGGKVSEQALAPTITEVSVTDSSITFTIKNEDTETAIIRYRIDDIDDEGEIIELAGGATSSNITESGLDPDETYTVFATANVTGKIKSNVTQLAIETDEIKIYTAATGGATEEYDSGGKRYKSHTFTSNGTFEVTTVGDADGDLNKVEYVVVAGGGGGNTGGGGAGGYRSSVVGESSGGGASAESKLVVSQQSYSITIGSGGPGRNQSGWSSNADGNGNDSIFSTITSIGGGRGFGADGGSGGGAERSSAARDGGLGTANQGFDGGDKIAGSIGGAGGGGANEVGESTDTTKGGNGGNGVSSAIRTGSNETRAGGGGGSAGGTDALGGSGGSGGGGQGGDFNTDNAASGTANTGGGGGGLGGTAFAAGNGGSGIVIIRYEIAPN